jgi:RNA polymerase sigma-70 factor (ECF subfamily)
MGRGITDPMIAALAFQRGEEEGFNYFFKTLYSALIYYAFGFLGDKESCEDTVEQVFIKIWDNHQDFREYSPRVIKSWLYTSVRNLCLNKLKSRKLEQRNLNILTVYFEKESAEPADHKIIQAEVRSSMRQLIQEVLPPERRKVFELLYIRGLSVAEAAKELCVTISTVKNQKAIGLEELRNCYLKGGKTHNQKRDNGRYVYEPTTLVIKKPLTDISVKPTNNYQIYLQIKSGVTYTQMCKRTGLAHYDLLSIYGEENRKEKILNLNAQGYTPSEIAKKVPLKIKNILDILNPKIQLA